MNESETGREVLAQRSRFSTTPSWQDPLAELLLGGKLRDGETLAVSAGDDGLVLGDRAKGATQGASATLH